MTSTDAWKIYFDDSPCEFRAIACDVKGRAWHSYVERWNGQGAPAQFGDVISARLTKFADHESAAFCELETGEPAFLRLSGERHLTEGQEFNARIASEARRGKLARIVVVSGSGDPGLSRFERWQNSLASDQGGAPTRDPDRVDAVFENLLQAETVVPHGGKVRLERTRALTAIDVDAAGRAGKGSAGARALSLARDAAVEALRQIMLRRLGGLIVVDCPGPLNRQAGMRVRDAVQAAAKQATRQEVTVLPVSALGLLEASLEWRYRPIEEIFLDEDGVTSPETELLQGMRQAEREAMAAPSAFFELALGERAMPAYMERRTMCDRALNDAASGRISVRKDVGKRTEVYRK